MTLADLDWTTVENALFDWIKAGTGLADNRILWAGQNADRPASGPWVELGEISQGMIGNDRVSQEWNYVVIPDAVISGVAANALAFASPHGLNSGDGPLQYTTTGVLPTGLVPAKDYWPVVTDPTHYRVATSYANARATVPVTIPITGAGSGVHTQHSTPVTTRAGAETIYFVRGHRLATMQVTCFAGGPPTPDQATGARSPRAILGNVGTALSLPSVYNGLVRAKVGVSDVGNVTPISGVINSSRFEPRAVMMLTFFLPAELTETGTYVEHVRVRNDDTGENIDA